MHMYSLLKISKLSLHSTCCQFIYSGIVCLNFTLYREREEGREGRRKEGWREEGREEGREGGREEGGREGGGKEVGRERGGRRLIKNRKL